MMKIECPTNGLIAENCEWKKRSGSVRDDQSTGIIECKNCHLVTHNKDLSQKVNYSEGSMHDWAAGYGGALSGKPDDLTRRVNALKILEQEYKFKSILDFGCGSGEMLEAFSGTYTVLGIEPDSGARELAKKKVQLGSIYESSASVKMQGTLVDVVTLFHVVEHFYDPSLELERIYELLKPGGLLIIETPNSCDALLTKYENLSFQDFTYWSHHPMLHSHKSLSLVVARNGFKILECRGVQRYDLNNHLYWLSKGMPGGHDIWKGMFSEDTIQSYGRDLVNNLTSDTLWLVAQKTY
jgi:2-polyprenyl-3-methyl-5-hydroxy-6-metoxy-1,4-benzoquinol methylase